MAVKSEANGWPDQQRKNSDFGEELHTQALEMDYTEAKYLSYFKKITYTMIYIYI